MKNRSGMNHQNSSKQSSQGNEGKRKNERKGSVNTNPSHEVPNLFSGISDSNPIGKKPKVDEDSKQADLKNQQESSETRVSEQEIFEFNPKPSQEKKKKRKTKNRDFESESEEEREYKDQNDFVHQRHNHFDNSYSDSQNFYAERDEKVEEEAENVDQEDEHENVTPDATNEPPNSFYDEDFEENPDFSENPVNPTEDEPYVRQSDSGHHSGPHSSKTQESFTALMIQAIRKVLTTSILTPMITPEYKEAKGDTRTPQVGKSLGFMRRKPMKIG